MIDTVKIWSGDPVLQRAYSRCFGSTDPSTVDININIVTHGYACCLRVSILSTAAISSGRPLPMFVAVYIPMEYLPTWP